MGTIARALSIGLALASAAGQAGAFAIRPACKDPGRGLLFYASFDRERRAEVAAGADTPCISRYAREDRSTTQGRFVRGAFGNAATGHGRRGSGEFDALGNVLPERGTIAFHIRQTGMAYGFEPLRLKTVDPYYWHMYVRISNKGNRLSAWFPNEVYKPNVIGPGSTARLGEGEWHHIAVVWDQVYGARLYLDGREVASNWGNASWTSRGVDPDSIDLEWGAAYDELVIYDRPLSAEQIALLAEENVRPKRSELAPVRFDDSWRRNRLRELSWQRPDPAMPKVVLGRAGVGANAVTQVVAAAARAVMKDCSEVFDGKLGRGWPPLYNYEFANGNGLHVRTEDAYDLVTIEGYFRGAVYGRRQLDPEGAEPIHRVRSTAFLNRWRLAEPRGAGWLSFFKEVMEDKGELPDKELVTSSRICELGLFRLGVHRLAGATPRRFYLGPASLEVGPRLLRAEFFGRFGPGDRAGLALTTRPPDNDGGQAVPALRYHHLLVPAAGTQLALRGIRLVWWAQGELEDNVFRVEVRDPVLPGRRLFALDLALDRARGGGPERLDLTLDLADRVLPADRPLWLTFCFKKDIDLLWAGQGRRSFIELLTGTREQVLPEYLRNELSFVRTRFHELSEARPWGGHRRPETEMVVFNRFSRELFYPLLELWKLDHDDPRVRAIWLWTHKHHVDTSPIEAVAVPGCPEAPRWALLQRELLGRCRDVLYWWAEHRQAPNGELGDGWGDDTDLIQNVPKLVLLGDPGGRLARMAEAVAEGVYRAGLITRGINTRSTDTLHAYEEGVNAQPVMALIDYGNPLYLERMMEAALTVDEYLMARDVKGRRRFRSGHFGANEVRDKGRYGVDSRGNALFLHPALFLAYYSRNPRAVRVIQEWIDGWLDLMSEHKGTPKARYPARSMLDGTVTGWDAKVRGYGFIDCFVALQQVSGLGRYAAASKYWTATGGHRGAFMRGGNYLPALELFDHAKFRKELIRWAEEADLTHPGADNLGRLARERYMKWQVTGDESAAVEALEACVRKLRLTFEAHTWAEPINDRIWLPDHPLVLMTQGEMSDERNQLWPRHYVSYQGFTDFAAWVREKSDTHLKVWLYSFAPGVEDGAVRVWRTPLGTYAVRFGPGRDGEAPPGGNEVRTLELHRSAVIPLWLPPRRLCTLEVRLVKQSAEDYWQRPDLGISARDATWVSDQALAVTIHNLGNSRVEGATLRLTRPSGERVASRPIPAIDPPLDLAPRTRRVILRVPGPARSVVVTLDPANAVAELNEENNTLLLMRE